LNESKETDERNDDRQKAKLHLRQEVLTFERYAVIELLDKGHIDDESLRQVERELDLEEQHILAILLARWPYDGQKQGREFYQKPSWAAFRKCDIRTTNQQSGRDVSRNMDVRRQEEPGCHAIAIDLSTIEMTLCASLYTSFSSLPR
jgi:hypothetical protein